MSYHVEFTSESTDGLEKLTSAIQERILSKIRWLSENLDNCLAAKCGIAAPICERKSCSSIACAIAWNKACKFAIICKVYPIEVWTS